MNEKFTRLENETDKQYQTRLSQYKLLEGEDLDWEDIKELLESSKHRDTLRREGYGIEIATEVYEEKINQIYEEHYQELRQMKDKVNQEIEDKRLKEIDNKVLQLEKEKIKLKDQRNDLNAIKRTIARTEHIVECMQEYIEELGERKPLLGAEIVKEVSDCVGICVISDIHLGVEVDNILTQYSPEICKKKMTYYINEVIKYGKTHNVSELYVLGLGDYVSGVIHNTNRLEARLNIVEQVMEVSELLAESIGRLSEHFYCKVAIVQGNHDDIRLESKDNHLVPESFTFFINEFVERRLKENKNVEFLEMQDKEKEFITFEINGFKFFASHGNRDKDRQLDRTIEMFECPIDYILRGHFHNASLFCKNNTWVVTNGCFSGENYTKHSRLYAPSIQKFLVFDKNGIRCNYDINLDRYKDE